MATGGSKLTVSDPVSVGHPRSDQLQATVTDSGETHVKGVRASEASPRTAIQRADEGYGAAEDRPRRSGKRHSRDGHE